MQRNPNQAEQHPTKPQEADETMIAEAWQEQVAQAQSSAKLAAELRHTRAALYRRFVAAYRDLLALSRARRRKLLRSMGMSLSGAALAFALALGQVPIARAAGIGVGGSCTLIDAITAANTDTATGGCAAGSGADTITLPGGAITLTSVNAGDNGLPFITSTITIAGNGTTIARDGSAPEFRILQVEPGGDLTLNNTTISGGDISFNNGGGLSNGGMLTLNNSTVSGNSANNRGGGIYNRGTLTLNNSTVSDNTAIEEGGGIFNFSGSTLMLNNSTVSGNSVAVSGGGITNRGTATLTNSTVSGNTAGYGGGISNFGGTLTLDGSTVSGNTTNSQGGGIFNIGTATLTNSTVSGNTAIFFGGGIFNFSGSTLTLNNSTVSGNTAGNNGGGIFNGGTATLVRSLISGNAAPSGWEAYNKPDSGYYSPPGIINSANYNLFGHSGESNAQAFSNFTPSGSDISATSDGTMPTALASILDTTLQNNGGGTLTHALVTGSPAVDPAPSGPAADQRGVARPQGCGFDSGAFELESAASCNTAPVATNDSYSTNEDTALNVSAPGVLGNDTDADSDPLTALLVSGPAHGTLTLNPNGSFIYTPAANYSGADSFSYKANDGTADFERRHRQPHRPLRRRSDPGADRRRAGAGRQRHSQPGRRLQVIQGSGPGPKAPGQGPGECHDQHAGQIHHRC